MLSVNSIQILWFFTILNSLICADVNQRNLFHKKKLHRQCFFSGSERETYRDESNGTTKSKNKLRLTIFHKRMTSWCRRGKKISDVNMSRSQHTKTDTHCVGIKLVNSLAAEQKKKHNQPRAQCERSRGKEEENSLPVVIGSTNS